MFDSFGGMETMMCDVRFPRGEGVLDDVPEMGDGLVVSIPSCRWSTGCGSFDSIV